MSLPAFKTSTAYQRLRENVDAAHPNYAMGTEKLCALPHLWSAGDVGQLLTAYDSLLRQLEEAEAKLMVGPR